MADAVETSTAPLDTEVQIDTMKPDPELESVHPECETLSPALELVMIPTTITGPAGIGGGVYPTIEEKEHDDNEETLHEEKEEKKSAEVEQAVEEVKAKDEAEEKPSPPEEQPLVNEEIQGNEDDSKDKMALLFQSQEFKGE